MSSTQGGLMAVWMNVVEQAQADFDAWYTRQHIPERVGVPGFRVGTRYEALQGKPRFLAVYDTDSPAVLSSPPYLARLNDPTPWTQRVMPNFRDTIRCLCRVQADVGQGVGAVLRTYRLEPAEGGEDALRAALTGDLPQRLLEQPGTARVRVAEALERPDSGSTAEIGLRGPDATASFLLLVDATDADAVRQACEAVIPEKGLKNLGVGQAPEIGDYRLQYVLAR